MDLHIHMWYRLLLGGPKLGLLSLMICMIGTVRTRLVGGSLLFACPMSVSPMVRMQARQFVQERCWLRMRGFVHLKTCACCAHWIGVQCASLT